MLLRFFTDYWIKETSKKVIDILRSQIVLFSLCAVFIYVARLLSTRVPINQLAEKAVTFRFYWVISSLMRISLSNISTRTLAARWFQFPIVACAPFLLLLARFKFQPVYIQQCRFKKELLPLMLCNIEESRWFSLFRISRFPLRIALSLFLFLFVFILSFANVCESICWLFVQGI